MAGVRVFFIINKQQREEMHPKNNLKNRNNSLFKIFRE